MKDDRFQGNHIASPKALTIQYMVLFSHLTVQVPTKTKEFQRREKLTVINMKMHALVYRFV